MTDNYYSRIRDWPSRFSISERTNILDIGCGSGVLGSFLKKKYLCSVTGIEILEEYSNIAKKKLDKVITEDFETMEIENFKSKFDYIIFSDSLEHMYNTDLILQKASKLLADKDSKILIALPNIQNFRVTIPLIFKGNWDYVDEGLLDRTHIRFFTLSSFKKVLKKNNFIIKDVKMELPLNSKTGLINFFTLGIFKNHLTSHFYYEICKK